MNYIQLRYDLELAIRVYHIREHPIDHMKSLGYNVIAGVPQSIGECWWFTVEREIMLDIERPDYLIPMKYNYDYWHGGCHKNCDFFKEDPCCCSGGFNCKKVNNEN